MNLFALFKKDKPFFVQGTGLFIFAAALPFSVSLIQGGILLFIAASLWRRHVSGTLKTIPAEIKSTPLLLPWTIYLGVGILAAAFGINPSRSFGALNSDLLTAVTFLGLCLFLEPRQRSTALNIYLVAVTAAALLGLYQAVNGLAHGLDVRAHGTNHPVRFGEILVIGLAFAISRISTPEELSRSTKKSLYASALLITSAILLSQTRGAYLGMAFVFAVIFLIKRPTKRVILQFITAITALGVAISIINPTIRYKIASILTGATSAVNTQAKAPDRSIGTRLILWKTGFKIIKDHPLLGVGPANVKKVFPVYCPKPYPENTVWGSLHNLYIHQTAERGFLGLIALIILFASMFVTALRGVSASPSVLTIWALAIMAPWFIMNLTEITFQHVHTSYAVLLALGVSITSARQKQPLPPH